MKTELFELQFFACTIEWTMWVMKGEYDRK